MTANQPTERSSPARRSLPYARYAAVYDRIGQRSFGERIAEATLAHLAELNVRPMRAIDLACGTGAATLILAAAGIDVTGIDSSESMLARAGVAADDFGVPVKFIEMDIRDFAVERQVDLITCFYDSINYVTSTEDLGRVFRNVHAALAPAGLFIFDLNTRAKFAAAWNESCYVACDRDDVFGVYQSWYEPETGLSPLTMTFFVRTLDGTWERFDEEHVERAYDLNEIQDMLATTGFMDIEMLNYNDRSYRFGGPGSEQSHRVVFIARRSVESGNVENTR